MNHDHEISHLQNIDRRKFLQLTGLTSGLVFNNSLITGETASALLEAKLPGFAAFAKTKVDSKKVFDLTYSLNGSSYHVKYTASLSEVNINFVDSNGATRNEVYQRK